jgi:hypothetical protein
MFSVEKLSKSPDVKADKTEMLTSMSEKEVMYLATVTAGKIMRKTKSRTNIGNDLFLKIGLEINNNPT